MMSLTDEFRNLVSSVNFSDFRIHPKRSSHSVVSFSKRSQVEGLRVLYLCVVLYREGKERGGMGICPNSTMIMNHS